MPRLAAAAVLWLLVTALSPVPSAWPGTGPSIIHGPYLTAPAADAMTILWFTDKPGVSWVEYATGGGFQTFPRFGGLVQTARSSRHGLIAAGGTRHEVRLTGLKPGQAYRYRVATKGMLQFEPYEVVYGPTVLDEIREFRTLDPAAKEFGFRVFQDLHGDPARLERLAARADLERAALVFFNGDTLEALSSEDYIFKGFLDPAVRLFATRLPLVYIRGNHDTRGSWARRLGDFFPGREDRFYYSFDQGPVHFVVLDSGEDKPDDSPVYAGLADFDRYRREQAEWLRREVGSEAYRKAAFRIVLVHMPLFGQGYGVDENSRLWGPILDKSGVDLLLAGHYHRLLKVEPTPERNDFPVLAAPQDAVVIASVSEARIEIKIVNSNGDLIHKEDLARRSGQSPRP
jgi:acid phosphatase type 7